MYFPDSNRWFRLALLNGSFVGPTKTQDYILTMWVHAVLFIKSNALYMKPPLFQILHIFVTSLCEFNFIINDSIKKNFVEVRIHVYRIK